MSNFLKIDGELDITISIANLIGLGLATIYTNNRIKRLEDFVYLSQRDRFSDIEARLSDIEEHLTSLLSTLEEQNFIKTLSNVNKLDSRIKKIENESIPTYKRFTTHQNENKKPFDLSKGENYHTKSCLPKKNDVRKQSNKNLKFKLNDDSDQEDNDENNNIFKTETKTNMKFTHKKNTNLIEIEDDNDNDENDINHIDDKNHNNFLSEDDLYDLDESIKAMS